uniref:Ring finger and CCCH-type domains 2 n=1 Tax=Laticauda laticaudata TaxID=8630 RepID=A0A8C5WZC8_LATLA
VLQRTGDPANLNRLRPHLEFLANIDPNPDAASPTWEQLENATVAVKTVVRGLVDFIQNHSRKGPEIPQPQPNSKYKTSLCRDLRQQGGCPRGTNCTFAHSQEELEKYRLRNKKISAAPVRPFPLLGKASISTPISATVGNVLPIIGNMDPAGKASSSTNRSPSPEIGGPQLIPRCMNSPSLRTLEHAKKGGKAVANSQNPALSPNEPLPEHQTGSSPKTPVTQTAATSAGPISLLAPKPSPFTAHLPIYPAPSESLPYFQDPRAHLSYEAPPYPPTGYFPSPPAVAAAVPPCLPRFVRSSNVSESPLPPASLQYSEHYSTFPARDRLTAAYQQAQPQPYGPVPPVPSGMYAPVYDSRRIWRPLMYQRDDLIRSNSLPPMEVAHPSVYHSFLRERYGSLDSYCSVPCQVPAEQRAVAWAREPCGHLKPAYEDPLRKKPEQWAPCHIPKVPLVATSTLPAATPSPSSPSPLFCMDFSSEVSNTKYEDGQLCQYSPWSCSTLSSCIRAVEAEPKDVLAKSSAVLQDLDSGDPKRPAAHLFETQRKAKEEDPIIPFSDGPIISKWGAISRSSRTGYHTTDPVQATASQGSTTKPISMSDYIPSISSVDLRWSCYVSDSTSSESAPQKHSSTRVLLTTDLQQAKSNSVLLQREANALAMQQKWNSLSEGSALTFKLLGKEMELRNGQADSPKDSMGIKSNRDIELELSSLDTDEAEGQGEQMKEMLGLQLGSNDQNDNLFGGLALENGHPVEQPPVDTRQAKRSLLHEEFALL